MNTRFLVRTILAAASVATFNAAAADLKDVYKRALTSDPLIREADANRLAARESKPQAIAALLPQVNADGTWNDTVDRTVPASSWRRACRSPRRRNFEGDQRRAGTVAAPEHLQLGELGDAQARQRRTGPGRSRLPGRPAGPDRAHGRGLLQRARGAGHARSRTGGARRHRPPARTVREALRGRPDRRHRRAGRQGRLRFRDRGVDPGQAQPRDHGRAACAS